MFDMLGEIFCAQLRNPGRIAIKSEFLKVPSNVAVQQSAIYGIILC